MLEIGKKGVMDKVMYASLGRECVRGKECVWGEGGGERCMLIKVILHKGVCDGCCLKLSLLLGHSLYY